MSKPTLLVDADMLAFRNLAACEYEVDWGDDIWTMHCNHAEAKDGVHRWVETAQERLGVGDVVMTFSDDDNWRKTRVWDLYKANRKGSRKPLGYRDFVEWMKEEWPSYVRPGLEADDLLGLLATHPKIIKGPKIVYSGDKDLKQVPGVLWAGGYDEDDDPILTEITEAQADYWHLYQTLIGDKTDGYAGCPGVGPVKAAKIIGEMPGDADAFDAKAAWPKVVQAFEKAKLNEAEALLNARLARICRRHDYDIKKKEVILWTP